MGQTDNNPVTERMAPDQGPFYNEFGGLGHHQFPVWSLGPDDVDGQRDVAVLRYCDLGEPEHRSEMVFVAWRKHGVHGQEAIDPCHVCTAKDFQSAVTKQLQPVCGY